MRQYVVRIEDAPRHWWQRRMIQLHCSCGWISPEQWPLRSMDELRFVDNMTRRTFAEIHLSREHRQ